MFEENLLIIISAILLLVLLWIIVGVRHLRYLRNEIENQWELIDEALRRRLDLIPNLVETIKRFTSNEEDLINTIIKQRIIAAKEKSRGATKIECEEDITNSINNLFNLSNKYPDLKMDTNFLELRKEIDDLEQNIEDKTNTYNEMVRYFKTFKLGIEIPNYEYF